MNFRRLLTATLALSFASALALAVPRDRDPAAAPSDNAVSQKRQVKQESKGERVFQQQCSRCHAAPDGFSPSISGTVLRHMRVRASLSRHEEEELLRFLNP